MRFDGDHSIPAAPYNDVREAHPPTVLQVLPSLETGGAERGCVDVAAAIVAAGGRAIVASEGGRLVHELTRAGAEHVVLPLKGKNPLRIRANIGRLAELIRRERVDIVHARSRAPAWSAYYAAREAGAAFMTTFHAHYSLGFPGKRLYNGIMARGERIIAISDYVARYILDTYRVDPSIVRIIPRGVDVDRFDSARVSAERVIKLAREWRLPDGYPVILMPARVTRIKGHAVLLEALALLGRQDIRCLIVGSDQGRTAYRKELENKIETLGLRSVVHLAGHCDDIPAALKLADVVAAPAIVPEGFGRVVVEAQAMGRPVVASDIGAYRETVVDGETGWLVPPGDAEALARALAQALSLGPEEREAFAARTSSLVRATYTRERMCAETLAVYDELLEVRA
jgi:glycosyltransferase involved in cell wall biosynthesis